AGPYHIGLDLLQCPAGEERAGAADERHQTGGRQTRPDPDHVLLGDAHVDQPVRERLPEGDQVGGADRVVAHGHDPLVLGGQRDQLLGERGAVVVDGRGGVGECHTSSLVARATCSAVGTLWCHSTRSSMNETPLPLIVWAMIATGRPSLGLVQASCSARWSWPSTSRTAAPNASSLAASGSRALVSSVRSPCCKRFRSTITVRLSNRWCAAAISASQLLPSCSSPSPQTTYTRESCPSRRTPIASPTATGSPCPSGPVLVSTPGTLVRSGCPFSAEC